MPLASFEKLFGLKGDFAKGHFPYKIQISKYLQGNGVGQGGEYYESPGLPPKE